MIRHFIPVALSLFASFHVWAQADAKAAPDAQTKPPEASQGLGYATVSAAREALTTRQDVRINNEGGWTLVMETPSILWSFTPSDHPAYPAVLRRELKRDKDGVTYVDMNGLCEAEQTACNALMLEYQAANQKIVENLKQNPQQAAPAGPPIISAAPTSPLPPEPPAGKP